MKNSEKETYFSDMTDWNPAEIIGNNPNPLDYSLYNFLIMKNSWQKGRIQIGYNKKLRNYIYVILIKSTLVIVSLVIKYCPSRSRLFLFNVKISRDC